MLDAKCPQCNDKAQVSDDMTTIQCKKCGYSDSYQNYIEKMKTKAENMADNFQFRGNVWSHILNRKSLFHLQTEIIWLYQNRPLSEQVNSDPQFSHLRWQLWMLNIVKPHLIHLLSFSTFLSSLCTIYFWHYHLLKHLR